MSHLIILFLSLFLHVHLWFAVSLMKSRNDVADIAWGLGIMSIAWLSFALWEAFSWIAIVVNIFISLWGLRLAWHISSRHAKWPEDARYLAWRKSWGKYFFVRSYLQIFWLQGILMFLVAIPVILINWNNIPWVNTAVWLGICLFITGFIIEIIADTQLRLFLSDSRNHGKLIQTWLWRYSRHPNYFGEVLLWCGIGIISVGSGKWYGLVGSILIAFLIIFVSWIPLLERKYAHRLDWKEYQKNTSIFFPWPKKQIVMGNPRTPTGRKIPFVR